LATEDEEEYLLKEYNCRASFLTTYLKFECGVFWQSEWQLILPHCNETEMINFLVVMNTFANNNWTLTAATFLYDDLNLMRWSKNIKRMLAKIVAPFEDGIINSDNGTSHKMISSHAITFGRFLGVLFVENKLY